MVADKTLKEDSQTDNTKDWFNEMVQNLRLDETLLENDILEKQKGEMYNALINKNHDFTNRLVRNASSIYFINEMVKFYIKELSSRKPRLKKLALELSNSKVLVWAEIDEDDEEMEDILISVEAKINSKFSKDGFHVSSTIVETVDNLLVPSHYSNVEIQA